MKTINYIILFAFTLLISCGADWEDDLNTRGGENRRNSYEFLGTFHNSIAKESSYKDTASAIIHAPLALKVGNIVAGTRTGEIVLSNYDNIKWMFKFEEENSRIAAGLCADEKMNCYAVTTQGYLYSIDIAGKVRWKLLVDDNKERFEMYSDLLYTDDKVFFSSSSGQLKCISNSGKLLWEKELPQGVTNAVAADEVGNIFLQLSEGTFAGNEKLLMFDSDGNNKWEINIDNFRFYNYPSYYKGKIYSYGQHGSGNNKRSFIYVHDTTGNEKLALEFPITIRSLSVDNNENMYITAYNTGVAEEKTGVFKLDSKGEIIWKLYFQAQSVTPMLISENLTAFLGITSEGPGLFFLDVLNGRVSKALALGNNSAISSSYAVIRGPEILFPKAYEYGYVRVTSTAIERIIPF